MTAEYLRVRHIIRSLVRRPGVTVPAIVAISIGMGVLTAVFAVAYTLLWRPLPMHSVEKLVTLYHAYPKLGLERADISPPSFAIYQQQRDLFDKVTAIAPEMVLNLTGAMEPEQIHAQPVARDFFQTLNVPPYRGRGFYPEEDDPAHSRVTVLSYELWIRRYGGNDGIVGQKIQINAVDFTVVGVAPPRLRVYGQADLWIPLALRPFQMETTQHGNEFLIVIARLRDGVTFQQASAGLALLSASIRNDYAKYYPESSGWHIGVARTRDDMLGSGRSAVFALVAAVVLVYLIVCFDFAILLMAGAVARSREIATRLALGANFSSIAAQFLAESLAVALTGSALGICISQLCLKLLLARILIPDIWPVSSFSLDWRVLAIAFTLAAFTGAVFGLVSVRQVRTSNLSSELNASSGTQSLSFVHSRAFHGLVAAEVCLSTVLMLGTGILVRSFIQLRRVELGFQTNKVVSLQILLPRARYADQGTPSVFDKILQDLQATSPATKAGVISDLPLRPSGRGVLFTIQDRPPAPGTMAPRAAFRVVSSDLFASLGIELVYGRNFTDQDRSSGMPVVVVDESMAKRFWPRGDPLGKHVSLSFETSNGQPIWREVVGVVRVVHTLSVDQDPGPTLYVPLLQTTSFRSGYLVARSREPEVRLVEQVRASVRRTDPNLPTVNVLTMAAVVDQSLADRRTSMLLVTILSAVALSLAAFAIFGVLSYSVARRRRELAVRMALGARPARLLALVITNAMVLVGCGLIAGTICFALIYRLVARFAFGISSFDPVSVVLVWVTFAAVGLLAAAIPAWCATRVECAVVLRSQ